MFGKEKTQEAKNKERYNLAVKYKEILDNADVLPPNSKEMYRVIIKAGLKW